MIPKFSALAEILIFIGENLGVFIKENLTNLGFIEETALFGSSNT